MRKTYIKNIIRTIRGSLSRFGAIFAIVALGVGFLAGLLATTPDMRYSGDVYFDDTHLFDVRVVSTLGLTDGDVTALRAVEGVTDVMPAYAADLLVNNTAGDIFVARFHSVPLGTIEQQEPAGYLNRMEVVEGRLPVKENECVVEQGSRYVGSGVRVGDTLTVSDDNKKPDETLARREFEVVGIVQSSYYFSMERESASVGNGTIGLVLYTGEKNFLAEAYSSIYLSLESAQALNSLSTQYEALVDSASERLEAIGDTQCEIRYRSVKDEAEQTLADAKEKYESAKAEADEKLSDVRAQLDDGQSAVQENEKKLQDAQNKITSGQKELAENRVSVPELLAQKQAELIAGRQALTDAKAQYEAGKAALAEQEAQVKALRTAFDSAKEAAPSLRPMVAQGQAQLTALEAQLAALQKDAAAAGAAYEAAKTAANYDALSGENDAAAAHYAAAQQAVADGMAAAGYASEAEWVAAQPATAQPLIGARDAARTESEAAAGRFDAAQAAVAPAKAAKEAAEGGLAAAQSAYAAAKTQLETAQGQLNQLDALLAREPELLAAEQQIAGGKAQLAAVQKQLAESEAQLNDGDTALSLAADKATQELAQAEKALADARAQYEDGKRQLADAKDELAEGEAEYATQKKDAEKQLAEAKEKLEDGEKAIRELEFPEWYVLGRDTNVSFASFRSNVEKVEAIAKIFPIFFFLVAALVALTTMTRMVEEERLQIGTMKALGYRKSAIMAKYLIYALTASVLGSAAGLAVGLKLFPQIIWNAYTMMYTLPKLYCLFNANFALLAAGAAIACTLVATLNACWATLAECPAQLMLPRAPKAGKRILLERITPVWRRMKFTHKVTARNLFRYKKRFLMTVIGISGCTALLVAGFGLHDSISDIVNKQFGEIFTSDFTLTLKNEDAAHSKELLDALAGDDIDAYMSVHQEKSSNTYGDLTFNTYLYVPESSAQFSQFVTLRTRLGHAPVPFSQTGIVITEKMSERTGYGVGDEIELENTDGKKGTFTITGVAENYVENYVYLSADLYEEQFGSAPSFNSVTAKLRENTQEARDAAASRFLKVSDVASVSFVADLKESFSSMMSKIDTIVVVLIVSAGLLAFVVLYNLTNINITERTKEIATIKVLGFYDKEVSAYVYRENVVLTLVGTLAGFVLGILLHKFVIYNVEVDIVMFGRTIKAMSYVFSAALTMVFSLLVNAVMQKKLRNISMVESMKAPE